MLKKKFKIQSKYSPAGDQPEAINSLIEGIKAGLGYQTLLGVTGSEKLLLSRKSSRVTEAYFSNGSKQNLGGATLWRI